MLFQILVLLCLAFGLCFGVWCIGDGWFSILHYKKTAETFWKNNIFRYIRLFGGLILILTTLYLGLWILL